VIGVETDDKDGKAIRFKYRTCGPSTAYASMSEAIQAATSTATEEEQKPPIPTTENERRWQIIHKVNWENIDTASFRAIDSYTLVQAMNKKQDKPTTICELR
jgi:hypothetical protein